MLVLVSRANREGPETSRNSSHARPALKLTWYWIFRLVLCNTVHDHSPQPQNPLPESLWRGLVVPGGGKAMHCNALFVPPYAILGPRSLGRLFLWYIFRCRVFSCILFLSRDSPASSFKCKVLLLCPLYPEFSTAQLPAPPTQD